MKLCRFGQPGTEKPGLIDGDGKLRDLSSVVADIGPGTLSEESLVRLAALDSSTLPRVESEVRFGVPWTGISKYVGIGLNYADHAAEAGLELPSEPIIFLKANSAICGPNDDTLMLPSMSKLDWEVELGVVIGRTARVIGEEEAQAHIAGYCLLNDVSERAFQLQSSQWDKGKGCDTFGPVGPWLVTKDEIPDPQALALQLDVNGVRRQDGTTANMIFGVNALVAYVSRYMTLLPGDVIATGTPSGVAMGMKPSAQWLRAGDVVELRISGLGAQRQVIVSQSAR